MPDEFPSDQKIDKQVVLAAIQAVREKGWDVNPFTVADEARIPPALLYRDPEIMKLIEQERGGGYLDPSLNVASQTQDLDRQNVELTDNVRQAEQKPDYNPNLYPNERAAFGEREPMPTEQHQPGWGESTAPSTTSVSHEPRKNGQEWQIYNVARINPVASEFNPLVGLTWKDIETVYFMRVETLRDYSRSIAGPLETSGDSLFASETAPLYRPYLAQNEGRPPGPGFVPGAPQVEARHSTFSPPVPGNGEPGSVGEIAPAGLAARAREVDQPPSSFTPEQTAPPQGNGEVDFAGKAGSAEALPEPPQVEASYPPPPIEAKEPASDWPPTESTSGPPITEITPESSQATGAAHSPEVEVNEVEGTPIAQSSEPFREEVIEPEQQPPSSPFITPDTEQKATLRGKPNPTRAIPDKENIPPPIEDGSASPFQKLKTSSSWPRPSTTQKPVNLQDVLAKGNKGQAPGKSDTAAQKPKPSAQEMAWEHFADSSQSNSETAPPPIEKTDASAANRPPDKPFANLFDKKAEKTTSPPEQTAWEHFSQQEPVKPSTTASEAGQEQSRATAAPETSAPTPEKSPTLDNLPALEDAPAPGEFAAPPPPASQDIFDAPISDASLAGPHYSFGTAYSFGFSGKTKPSPPPDPEVVEAQEAAVNPPPGKSTEEPIALVEVEVEMPEPAEPPPSEPASLPLETVEEVPDLETMDIFDDIDQLPELEEIEIIEEVVKDQGEQKSDGLATTISGDELREIIKSRIKQANQQLAEQPAEAAAEQESEPESSKRAANRSKFVGAAKTHEPPKEKSFVPKTVPPEIRKACLLLGVRPEEITKEMVIEAWKRQIASPGVHPDLGGDTESAIYLNTAKDTLIRWLEEQAPKLGKRFGQTVKTKAQTNPKKGSDKKDKAEKSE
jgi:hypothetical protein